MTKLCPFCGVNPKPKTGYCRPCANLYYSATAQRSSYAELTVKEKKRSNARAYANVYQRRGKLEKKPCQNCGTEERVEKHHHNYNKPLDVEWYCRDCHMKLHRGIIITKESKDFFKRKLEELNLRTGIKK